MGLDSDKLSFYLSQEIFKVHDYFLWLLGDKCVVGCCEQVAPLVLSADQFSEPISFKESGILCRDWMMESGSDF